MIEVSVTSPFVAAVARFAQSASTPRKALALVGSTTRLHAISLFALAATGCGAAASPPAAPEPPPVAPVGSTASGSTDSAAEKSMDAEAKAMLVQIGRDAAAAYEREELPANFTMKPGVVMSVVHNLCPSAKRVPDTLAKLAPTYASTTADWSGDPGWACLKFALSGPQGVQYEVVADPRALTFDAFARRKSATQTVEMSIHGERAAGNALKIGEVQVKRLPQ